MADISKEDLRKEIAAILKGADLASTSAKKVRQELEEKLEVKLASRKKEIDDLVMEFVSAKGSDEGEEDEEEEEEEEESETEKKPKKRGSTGKKPPAKKAKKTSDDSASEGSEAESDDDYSPKKAKPAKGRKLPPKKKKGSDSDSDEDYGKAKKKAGGGKRGGGGYTKSLQLSPELAALVGADSMARHEVVKKVWAIIKEKNLYDPKNKQYAICDDALMKVIGTKRFRTFGMMKYLKNHFIS